MSDVNRGGRPRKGIFERRAAPVTVRLTEKEMIDLEAAATKAGLTVSAFVRFRIFEDEFFAPQSHALALHDLTQVTRALLKINEHDLAERLANIIAQIADQ